MQKPVQQRPVPAKMDLSLVASSPNERNTLARLDGPQREALDCQETSCLNDAAAGSFHARSTASSAWITDDSIASGLTFVRLRTTPTPPTARTIETIAAARAAVQILVFNFIADVRQILPGPETIGLNSGKTSAQSIGALLVSPCGTNGRPSALSQCPLLGVERTFSLCFGKENRCTPKQPRRGGPNKLSAPPKCDRRRTSASSKISRECGGKKKKGKKTKIAPGRRPATNRRNPAVTAIEPRQSRPHAVAVNHERIRHPR